IVVVAAGNKRYVGPAEPVDRVAAQAPSDAAARTMTAAGSAIRGLERRLRGLGRGFLRRGAFWWAAGPAAAGGSSSPPARREGVDAGQRARPRSAATPAAGVVVHGEIPLIRRVPVRVTCAARCPAGR